TQHDRQKFHLNTKLLEYDCRRVVVLGHRYGKFAARQEGCFLTRKRRQGGLSENSRQTLVLGGIEREIEDHVIAEKAPKQSGVRNGHRRRCKFIDGRPAQSAACALTAAKYRYAQVGGAIERIWEAGATIDATQRPVAGQTHSIELRIHSLELGASNLGHFDLEHDLLRATNLQQVDDSPDGLIFAM